jgi:hypothetical protein
MKPGTLFAALFVTSVTFAAASPASAGGYVSLGIGDGADLHGDLAQSFDTDDSTSHGKFAIGQRTGPFAIEALVFGTDLIAPNGADYSTLSFGVDLKYFYGLGGNFELYGKGGLNKTWLRDDGESGDFSGRGKQLGLGLQYRFTTGLIGEVAVWLDLTRQYVELSDSETQSQLDGEIDTMNLGLSVGL